MISLTELTFVQVMGSLGPSINSAIAAAMRGSGLSSGATLTRGSPITTFQVFIHTL